VPAAGGCRAGARDPQAWEDTAMLAKLAETAPTASSSLHLLLALAERWRAMNGDVASFLRHVQREHPADFWANFTLACALKYRFSGEAISYFRVSLAIRPEAAITYYDLGDVLRFKGWLSEALQYYRKSLSIDPRNAKFQTGLGNLLTNMGQVDEAIGYFRHAVRDDPRNVWAQVNLGKSLKHTGLLDEALDHYQQALVLDPNHLAAEDGRRSVLMRQGQGEVVRVAWREVLESDP